MVCRPTMDSIASPHDNDILCGRGVVTHYHPSNATYRQLVNMNKLLYATLKKIQKAKLSRGIVRSIRTQDPPGRFLIFEKDKGLWHDIGDKKAVEKTSQALREGQPDTKEKMTKGNSILLTDIPSTTNGFAELISFQASTLGKEQETIDSFRGPTSSSVPFLAQERLTDRSESTFEFPPHIIGDTGIPSSRNVEQRKSICSDMSIFSTTPSMREMFTTMSTTGISLDLDHADCESMGIGSSQSQISNTESQLSLTESLCQMSIQKYDKSVYTDVSLMSKQSSDISDDTLRRAADEVLNRGLKDSVISIKPDIRSNSKRSSDISDQVLNPDLDKNPSVSNFRSYFRGVSDMTSSLSRIGISNKNLCRDSDFSIDTNTSQSSMIRNESNYCANMSQMGFNMDTSSESPFWPVKDSNNKDPPKKEKKEILHENQNTEWFGDSGST